MNDIETEADVEILVSTFYSRVKKDVLLAPVFENVIKDNWAIHLKKMTDFWSTLLLYTKKYHGDPLTKHLPLPIEKEHFDRWLELFNQTIDEMYSGEIANNARKRASSIARIMKAVKQIPE